MEHSKLSRRQFTGGLLVMTLLPWSAWAGKKDVALEIKARFGEREPVMAGITLDITPLTESGNSVPATIVVESPMHADDYVQKIHVFVEGNPVPVAATYHLSPINGVAQVSTRLRLARTQNVLVVAEHSDGRLHAISKHVTVTLGACADELWGGDL